MYITVKSIKRSLGFKELEIADIIIGIPLIMLFIIFFVFTSLKIPSLVILMFGIFCLLPINISKKNRIYKVIFLIIQYCFKDKIFVYQKG